MNHHELLDLLEVVDSADWCEVPISKARRGTRRDYRLPGSSEKAGDFVWYDTYTRSVIDSVTARDRSRLTRLFGGDLHKGFVFVADASVTRRMDDSSVVLPTVPVSPGTDVDVVMDPEILHLVDPSADPALVTVRYFLVQAVVPVDGVVSMADAVAKVAYIVTGFPVSLALPTVTDVGVN